MLQISLEAMIARLLTRRRGTHQIDHPLLDTTLPHFLLPSKELIPGHIPPTRQPFDEIPRTSLSTSSSAAAAADAAAECNNFLFEYSRNNLHRETLGLFLETHRSGAPVDWSTLSCVLKACGCSSDGAVGRQLHGHCVKCGYETDVSVGTSLVDMYMKCDCVEDGRRVFDLMPWRNVVSWTCLLTGYTQNGLQALVLELFFRMQVEGIKPNPYTFASVLTSSAARGAVEIGLQAHGQLVKLGFESTVFVCNSLMNMYCKCGLTGDAKKVFEKMEDRDAVSWNAMIAGLVQNGFDLGALELFYRMRVGGLNLTQLSFATVIKVCAKLKEPVFARQLHCCAIKKGFGLDSSIRTALMVVYSKCGEMDDAFNLFSTMFRARNVVSWTAMIGGYLTNGRTEQAVGLFCQMSREGVRPNDFTYSSILTASHVVSPSQIHAQVVKTNYESSPSVGTALVSAYTKLGNTLDALSVFRGVDEKDIVAWSAMLAGYAQVGDTEGAVKLFCEMAKEMVKPNEFTLSSVIDACSSSTATTEQGKQFHGISIKSGFEDAIWVGSALVTMYAKKGSIESAHGVFEKQTDRDLVSWNSMVCGYAQHGYGKKALEIFGEMETGGLEMDGITFIGVITACTHAGLVEEGQAYFDSMVDDHQISPAMEHYACMVDLYSRAGKIEEATNLIKGMPFPAGATVWRTLLGACRVHRNIELGKQAAEKLISLEPEHSAAYVLLSNIYAAAGKWEDRARIRKLMDERKVKKEAGYSWVEVKNKVHSFLACDRSHPLSDHIYRKLEELSTRLKEETGYRPDTNFVLHDVEEEHKETMLAQHSEKLAMAFGLIATPQGTPLQIVKNLRVCGDCHTVIKLVSAMEGRDVVVRDSNRFHHFKDGSCSCGDYW